MRSDYVANACVLAKFKVYYPLLGGVPKGRGRFRWLHHPQRSIISLSMKSTQSKVADWNLD
jgi:hypothetical protein